jgi:hypothetical protein
MSWASAHPEKQPTIAAPANATNAFLSDIMTSLQSSQIGHLGGHLLPHHEASGCGTLGRRAVGTMLPPIGAPILSRGGGWITKQHREWTSNMYRIGFGGSG